MYQDVTAEYQKHIVRSKRRAIWKKVISVMACAVIFCTTYALILPAITIEQETFCGLEEHSHSEACYSSPAQTNLICTAENMDVHTHAEECRDAEGNLICGKADYIAHTHEDNCLDAEGNLICVLDEREIHVHNDACYIPGETEAPVLHVHSEACTVSEKSGLICTLEEYEGHAHGDACYVPGEQLLCTKTENHIHGDECYTYPLICEESTDPHSHTLDCYAPEDLICDGGAEHAHEVACVKKHLICGSTEDGHTHADSCYGLMPVCQKTEGQVHAHSASCYSTAAELLCPETENHTHDSDCYEKELQCELPEDPGYAHSDACYAWEDVLVCQMEEGQPEPVEPAEPVLTCTEPIAQVHIHSDICFETVTVEPVPVCDNTDETHVHSVGCYELHCGLDEHTHATACYSDPEADVEDAAHWKSTFAYVELTGEWPEDVIAIAQTQLGYCESTKNYEVDDDNSIRGYTRYGDWYGVPYGDWCAMFVSFCLDYAEVENMPLHCGVRPWIEELTELKLYHDAKVYDPKSGDLIFFDWEKDGFSDHVGLVVEIIPETETTSAKIKTIEGNSGNRVQYVEYLLDDERIFGYSELPDNIEVYSCGTLRHTHNEYCNDSDGNFVCQQVEHAHTDTCIPRSEVFCGQEEHNHSEQCFDEAGELLCLIPGHIHTEECTKENAEPVYYCTLEEHSHGDACSNEAGELICETEEHTHTESCTEKPAETVYYCDSEEHTHSEACYDGNGTLICVTLEHIHGEACLIRTVYLCGMEAHVHGEGCHNEAGDLVCEVTEHSHSEQCLVQGGYICGFERHTHDERCYDNEGNMVCTIAEHAHTDDCLTQNNYACGMAEHTHSEQCFDEAENLVCALPEHLHTMACVGRSLYYSDESVRVHVVIRGVENLPRKLKLKVLPITQEEHPDYFGSMQVAVSEQMSGEEEYLKAASFYDLQLVSGDAVYELPETAVVAVTMEFNQPIFAADDVSESVSTRAFMLTPENGQRAIDQQFADEAAADEEDTEISASEPIVYASRSLIPAAYALEDLPEEDTAEDESQSGEVISSYQVSDLTGENYTDQSQGITSVTFETNQLSTFAVVLADQTVTGQYWERVYAASDLKSGETYMIVSAEGNYALLGNSNSNYAPVMVETVKGNTKYYTIRHSDGNTIGSTYYWDITPSGNGYTVRNQGTSNYIYLSNYSLLYSNSRTLTFNYQSTEKCWRISYNGNYLRNPGTGAFTSGSGSDGNYENSTYYYYTRDMLIFRESDVTELTIPADVTAGVSSGGTTQEAPEKPDYGDFITPSGGLSGETAVTDGTSDGVKVDGEYYSDPATSNIEVNYRKDTYAESQQIDGKVMTDKSVIYNDDDYGAFSSYDANTFGITLSALGQAYPLPYQDIVRTPVDVVFVLDVSGSMSTNESGSSASRAIALVDAVNTSIDQIMNDHEANRVGIALYSTDSWEMLPLDRYTLHSDSCYDSDGKLTCTNNAHSKYLKYDVTTVNFQPSNFDRSVYKILGNDGLKNDDGVSFANVGSAMKQGLGTYTQAGIARGRNIFAGIGSDTTYTTTVGEGDNIRQYTVTRQPVFILLSDGEPTHSTNNFMDVLNGPHYGDGQAAGNGNGKGIHGYNTVLSANYYKRMVAIQYQNPVLFYSIGMGINENGDSALEGITDPGTGDNYKRAVLNPTAYNISLSSNNNGETTIELLEELLTNNYEGQSVKVTSSFPDEGVGIPHVYTPALQKNPYADNFSYADKAYFGELPTEELKKVFNEILMSSTSETPYGFVLYQNTSVTMTDYIGAGMEVKGTPVLRYAGVNYRNPEVTTITTDSGITTTKYTYSGSYRDPYDPNAETADLSSIEVYITPVDHTPIYMCGNSSSDHTHTEAECGIYRTYLCDHHAHRRTCYENGDLSAKLICDDPHDHIANGCTEVTQTQRVQMIVPDKVLPIYNPELIGNEFYYESLPVRLIYQVGLTDQAEDAVLDLAENGGELTFYTNRWGGAQHARSDLLPSLQNPFYYAQSTDTQPKYDDHVDNKASNVTATDDYYRYCHWGDTIYQNQELGHVYHELGNNGKLVFAAEVVDIPVEKKWEGVNAEEQDAVTVSVYKVTVTAAGPSAEKVAEAELSASSDWKHTFTGLLAPGDDFYYVIAETVPVGYTVEYSGGTVMELSVDNGEPVKVVKVTDYTQTAQIIITNVPSLELPNTGGTGTALYYVLGTLLCGVFCLMSAVRLTKRKSFC